MSSSKKLAAPVTKHGRAGDETSAREDGVGPRSAPAEARVDEVIVARAGGARARRAALLLGVALAALVAFSLRTGSSGTWSFAEVGRGLVAWLGLGEPLERWRQAALELRLHRVATTVGVGAALALSGGLLQGVFRNALASPSIIGVTAGASLGASLAVLAFGGFGPGLALAEGAGLAPVAVSLAGLLGALATALFVTALSTTGGRVSVPTLLLVGVATNAFVSGALTAIQAFALHDFDLMSAILAWTFGTLDDRSPYHVALVWSGLAVAAALLPWVTYELDLFAGGEDDAQALGVHTARVKLLALFGASVAAAAAIAAAGQIAFVGLVVPHLLRVSIGASHRRLLPLCLLGGPVLLLGADFLQRTLLGRYALQPGVVMSLLGGPFFLFLLVRNRKELRAW